MVTCVCMRVCVYTYRNIYTLSFFCQWIRKASWAVHRKDCCQCHCAELETMQRMPALPCAGWLQDTFLASVLRIFSIFLVSFLQVINED